jgi:hypothetical protein
MSVASKHASPQPSLSPAEPAARLAPALVHGQLIYLQCPDWCVSDHVAENERHFEDIAHASAMTDLVVPGGDPSYRLLAHARIGSDPFGPRPEERGPFVVVDDGSEGHHLTSAEAEVFADRLVAFAGQVRALGRTIGAPLAVSS